MRRPLLAFRSSRSGASAIEFAIVAPLFLSLVFSGFEAGWLMTKMMLLDRALDSTIRLMRVGAADAPTTQAQIKQAICDRALIISDCTNVITVEMSPISSASDFPTSDAKCVDRGEKVQPTVNFTAGKRSSIMYIRACIVSDALTPGIGFALSLPLDAKGGYNLVSVGAFMNEPGA